MTYCVGLKMNRGLIFMSDTRTNAGFDNISTFSKMRVWANEGDRVIVLLSAGNLATTQAVIGYLDEQIRTGEGADSSLMATSSMFQTAKLIGQTVKEVIQNAAPSGQTADAFAASLVLGGQIRGEEPKLFYIYPEGNFIESSPDTPFFQIGEHKYGKPILVRAYDPAMSEEDAIKLLLVSFDSTLKSNLSVGLPLDLYLYRADSLSAGVSRRFERNDPYYNAISEGWSDALREAFHNLPALQP